jgi:ADP-heptose:LPS heptosyltransferase
MKILVIRFSSIGDIVLTTPVVRCLKTQLPAAEIHFCTKLQFKTIVENNPYISKTIYYQHSLSATIEALKAEKYDLIIDLHHNLRSLLIKLRLGVESRSFKKLNFKKWLLVKWKINLLNHSHVVDRYLDTVAHLGIVNDQQGLDYFIAPQDEINITDFGPAYSKGYEVYAIGGQHYTKKLPLFKMIELCQQIAAPLVLLGGKEDVDNGYSPSPKSVQSRYRIDAYCFRF